MNGEITPLARLKKNIQICAALALALCVLAAVPLFWQAGSRQAAALLFAAQAVLFAPVLYFARPWLRRGRQLLTGGVPAMAGLAFAAACCALVSCAFSVCEVIVKQNFAAAAGYLFAPLAVLLVLLAACGYLKQCTQAQFGMAVGRDDTAAYWLPAVFASALIGALSWWFYGAGAAAAWQALGAALIAGCSSVFVLARVLPLYAVLQRAAQQGCTYNNAASLTECGKITLLAVDHSLIKSSGVITDVIAAGSSQAQVIAMAAALAGTAGHPLSALLAAKAAGLPQPKCEEVKALNGGITARCNKQNLRLGGYDFVRTVAQVRQEHLAQAQGLERQGKQVYFLTAGRQLLGLIAAGQGVQAETVTALTQLRALGVRTVMFSSENKGTAEWAGTTAGFDKTVAELAVDDKTELAATFSSGGELTALAQKSGAGIGVTLFAHGAQLAQGFAVNGMGALPGALKLSRAYAAAIRRGRRLALACGAVFVAAALCWPLVFKAVLPGAALAVMLAAAAGVVCLTARPIKNNKEQTYEGN